MITKYNLFADDMSLKSKNFYFYFYIFLFYMFIFSEFHTNVEIEIDLLNYRVREGKMSREIRLFTKSWGIVDVFTDKLFIARNKLQLYYFKKFPVISYLW